MALEPAGVAFIAENIDSYIRDLGKADKAQQGLGDSSEGASSKLNILGSVITGASTAFVTFALDAVTAAGKALAGFAVDSIQVAIDFESSMATLSIAASATGLSFDELSETALAVGGDTSLLGVSASGAAESMEGLFKAGLTTEEVFGDLQGYLAGTAELGGTLRASIDLAAATTLDMVVASDVASIALATFGSEAEEAGISTDEWINAAMNNLVQAADASVAEVDGLVEALKMVGPAASAMGVTLAETNNALALLSTRGIQGSSAGTALNRMMADLVKGTPKATEMMEDLGISVYDSEGSFLPLVEIIGQFEIALGDATDAERDAAMASIFTAQGARAMNTLLEEGVQGWVDMTDATADAATMQEQAAIKGETLAAQQEALEGVIETLQIKIGSALLPALTDMTTIFSGLIDQYGPALTAVFEKIGEYLGVVTSEIGMLLEAFIQGGFDRFFSTFEDGSTYVGSFLEALGVGEETANKIGRAINGLVTGVKNLVRVFQEGGLTGFAEALGIDPGFIDSVIGAIDSIRQWFVTNGPAIESSLDQIGQVFGAVFGSIKEVIDDLSPVFEEIGATFGETFEIIKEVLGELGLEFDDTGSGIETVTGIIIGVIELMGGIITGVLTAVSGTVKFFAEHFQGVWMGIRDVIQGVKEWLEGFKQFWTALFNKDMPGALEGLEKGFKATAKFIKGMVKVIVKSISMPFKGLYKLIEGFVKGVIKFFENLKKKLVGGSIIPDMMDKIEKVIDTVLSAILKVWEKVFEKILDVTQDIFESIERTVNRVMTTVEKIIDTITTAIGGDWEDFVDLLFELWEETWDDIQDAVDTIFSAIEDLIDRIAGSIESLWESFTETLKEVWEDVWSAIEDFVDTTFSNIETLIDTISSSIETAWNTFTSSVQETWEIVWTAIETFVDTTFSNIETLINTISGSIQTAWEAFTGSIQSTWETVWGAIETFVDTTFNNIETLIETIIGSIETAWNTFTGAIQSTWETAWSAIQSFVDATFNAIRGLISSISGSIESAWGTFTSAIRTVWETAWNAIESFVNTVFGNVQTAISTISGAIEGTWNSWIGRLRSAFEMMFNALKGIVDTAMARVRDAVASALSALAGILAVGSNLYNGIMTIGSNIANSIRDGVTAAWEAVTGGLSSLLSALGAAGTFAMGVWSSVAALGAKVVTFIKTGLANAWAAAGGVVEALSSKLSALAGALGAVWSSVAAIGRKVVDWIKQGIVNAWSSFVAWLKEMVIGIFGGSEPTDLQSPFRKDKLRDAGDWIGRTMVESIEMGMLNASSGFSASLGMVAPAMMAPAAVSNSTEVNIGPVAINNGMDVAEFETRVRQAVSEAI